MLKHSKLLFLIFTVFGGALLAAFFIVFYWEQTWSIELLAVQRFLGDSYLEWSGLNSFFFCTLIAGTTLFIIGLAGIIAQSFSKHRAIFAALVAVLTPLLIFGTLVSSSSFFWSHQEEKLAITHFRVDRTSPLNISVDAKSSYYYEIDFDAAFIEASNQTAVAQIESLHDAIMGSLYELPPGDEQTLVFNFNTTLPPGEYSFWLSTYRQGNFISFNFAV